MSDKLTWQDGNRAYLTAAVAWLRLLLEGQGQQEEASKDQIARRAAEMGAIESCMQEAPALVELGNRLQLSRFECDILLLCVAMELDTRIPALCARAQDDPSKPYPTFALAMVLFDDPSWDALSPERPLRYLRLIEINQPATQPLLTSTVRADERIANYIKGLSYFEDRLASFMAPCGLENRQVTLPPSHQKLVQEIKHHWHQAWNRGSMTPIIQMVGVDAPTKLQVAGHVASEIGHQLYRLPVETLPSHVAELKILARLWKRESMLSQLALYLDAQEIESETPLDGQLLSLNHFLTDCDGIVFLSVRETLSRLNRAYRVVDVEKPTPTEQQAAWSIALGHAASNIPGMLASQFNLDLITIQQVAQSALDEAAGDRYDLAHRLWNACRLNVRPRLDMLAQRLDAKATWDDLVLADEEMSMLHLLCEQVGQRSTVYEEWGFARKMNRGLGINALFSGESGTGKTMAAEVIANALRLNLYRIDLSAVVSKYIGETEKNLRRLFDAAENGGAILFFDEADALFGKRSEVKDSHDRYANIEINYLLQRMEAYRGLAILATNMKSALDVAFTRRLRFMINFPFPGPIERKCMWQKAFPADTPRDQLDYDRLARLNLTGGSIHNIALNAAFLGAAQVGKKSVTMPLIFEAARIEFHKLERPFRESDLYWETDSAMRDEVNV
jgi:ATPase family associated with various cellular activities (AAA)